MKSSDDLIKEFMEAYKAEYGISLSHEEAKVIFYKLKKLVKIVLTGQS